MIRLLVLAAVAWLLAAWLSDLYQKLRGRLGPVDGRPNRRPPVARTTELVPCRSCGVHVPAVRALDDGRGGPFCSESCRRSAA